MVEKHQLSPKAFEFKGLSNGPKTNKGACFNVEYSKEPFNEDQFDKLFSKY